MDILVLLGNTYSENEVSVLFWQTPTWLLIIRRAGAGTTITAHYGDEMLVGRDVYGT